MSKKITDLSIYLKVKDMDKSTSEIKGLLTVANTSCKDILVTDCMIDVYVLCKNVSPLLLHSYTVGINSSLKVSESLEVPLNLDGIVLSSLASEIVDLEMVVRGSSAKCVLNINRTEYIDCIEAMFEGYGFVLDDYAVEIRNKLISKLFRQFYVYKMSGLDTNDMIRVTYTPYTEYLKLCIYHNGKKTRNSIKYSDIKSKDVIGGILTEIFNEHKIRYIDSK